MEIADNSPENGTLNCTVFRDLARVYVILYRFKSTLPVLPEQLRKLRNEFFHD